MRHVTIIFHWQQRRQPYSRREWRRHVKSNVLRMWKRTDEQRWWDEHLQNQLLLLFVIFTGWQIGSKSSQHSRLRDSKSWKENIVCHSLHWFVLFPMKRTSQPKKEQTREQTTKDKIKEPLSTTKYSSLNRTRADFDVTSSACYLLVWFSHTCNMPSLLGTFITGSWMSEKSIK